MGKRVGVWERSKNPPAVRIQDDDVEILKAVFKHRFLQPQHLYALLPARSQDNLGRRLRLLWQNQYLERPRAQRPTKILTQEIVYSLGRRGAKELDERIPELRIGRLDWLERPGKPWGWPYIDHQLPVSTFMVGLAVACPGEGLRVAWAGHHDRLRRDAIAVPGGGTLLPDCCFKLVRQDGQIGRYYLEVTRSRRSLKAMEAKYRKYHRWWRDGMSMRNFRNFGVLTIASDLAMMAALRKVAAPIAGKSFLFSHVEAFGLEPPGPLGLVWWYAEGEDQVRMV